MDGTPVSDTTGLPVGTNAAPSSGGGAPSSNWLTSILNAGLSAGVSALKPKAAKKKATPVTTYLLYGGIGLVVVLVLVMALRRK